MDERPFYSILSGEPDKENVEFNRRTEQNQDPNRDCRIMHEKQCLMPIINESSPLQTLKIDKVLPFRMTNTNSASLITNNESVVVNRTANLTVFSVGKGSVSELSSICHSNETAGSDASSIVLPCAASTPFHFRSNENHTVDNQTMPEEFEIHSMGISLLERKSGSNMSRFNLPVTSSCEMDIANMQDCTPPSASGHVYTSSSGGTIDSLRPPSSQTSVKRGQTVFETPNRAFSSSGSRRLELAGSVRLSSSGEERRSYRARSGARRLNPFDLAISADTLHLPTMSPSVFSNVVSPSQEEVSSNGGRFWSVEQQSELFPVDIGEDSPWKQMSGSHLDDPELENRTQEAIDRYFNENHKITSPPFVNSTTVLPPKSNLAVGLSSFHAPVQHDQGSQTTLTFPSVLPEEVIKYLSTYFTFNEDMNDDDGGDGSGYFEQDNQNVSANTSLRRKLFSPVNVMSSDEGNQASEDRFQVSMLSPGHVFTTPVADNGSNKEEINIKLASRCETFRTSISPPKDLSSPLVSPVSRSDITGLIQKSNGSPVFQSNARPKVIDISPESVHFHETSEYDRTQDDDDDEMKDNQENSVEMAAVNLEPALMEFRSRSHNISTNMDTDSQSQCLSEADVTNDVPVQSESQFIVIESTNQGIQSRDINGEGFIGAVTEFGNLDNNLVPGSRLSSSLGLSLGPLTFTGSSFATDSGVRSGTTSGSKFELFGRSDLSSGQIVQTSNIQQKTKKTENVSYTGDISMGFPLGSSTPTKD